MEFITNEFTFKSASGLCDIYAQSAAPSDFKDVKGVIQITHGMAEHSNRYARFAMELCKNGYAVYVCDLLGHGKSVASKDELGYFGDNGVDSLVEDMHKLTEIAKNEYPELPFIMFGHSMGSFLLRNYLAVYGKEIDGAVVCGTSGANPAAGMGIKLARYFEKTKGKLDRPALLNSIAFGPYNKRTDKRTEFDWLSRDEKEVDKYIEDPLCGFCFTANGFETLFTALKRVSNKAWYNAVPKELNILLIAGDNDPVGEYGKGVNQVFELLKKSGHTNTLMKLYPECRHELLNELNRAEVTADIVNWVGKVIDKK